MQGVGDHFQDKMFLFLCDINLWCTHVHQPSLQVVLQNFCRVESSDSPQLAEACFSVTYKIPTRTVPLVLRTANQTVAGCQMRDTMLAVGIMLEVGMRHQQEQQRIFACASPHCYQITASFWSGSTRSLASVPIKRVVDRGICNALR